MARADTDVADRISELKTLERSELVERWNKAYGAPPFKGARQATLIRGMAYHFQCKHHGGLKPAISRELLKIAGADTDAGSAPSKPITSKQSSSPKPKTTLGTQLVREWNGRTYTVHVTDKGFVTGGITYGSLSAVAKAITGSHRSGPRFFGVRG